MHFYYETFFASFSIIKILNCNYLLAKLLQCKIFKYHTVQQL